MLALSRAIEDECCATAERPVLMACFQRPRLYQASRRRWIELARTAEAAAVFADFPRTRAQKAFPLEVPLPDDAPLLREWAVIGDAVDYPAWLVGWEHPRQETTPDGDRRFEAIWSVDPRAVRHAARTCTHILGTTFPEMSGPLSERLAATPPGPSGDLSRAARLLDRMVDYLEWSRPPAGGITSH
jgi:DICT domain-containing protein